MAEKVGTLDINKLLADAAATAATNKAARAAAKAAADKAKASNAIEQRIKTLAQSASTRAEGLERIIQEDLVQIKMISRNIADQGGDANEAQLRDLKSYVKRYNSSITEQQRLFKESTDLSNGKYDVDERGKLTPKIVKSVSAVDIAKDKAMAGRGGTPKSVVVDATADEAKAGVKPKVTPTPTPTPTKKKKTPPPVKKVLSIDEIIDAVANEYGSIDTIFKTDPGLQDLLRKAIGKDGVPNTDDDLTPDQFVKELENTDWFKTNAGPVRQRGFYKRQFDDLVAGGSDPEELYKTTEYGRGLKNTQQVIADEIVKVGGNLSPEDIETLSRDIYDLGYENQRAIVSQRIRAKISYKPGGIVSGQAGENLADLRKTAKANGLDLEKNFGDSVQGWLQKLAQGESIETFKQIIRGSAKIGLPEKVSSLLDQGVDLDTVYNPYKRLMASVLEINPETITLDDSVLRSAIGPDKEMSLYDFQKMLRKDNRWQYTNQAKEEVSNTALRVLRDFGFQG